MLTYNIFVGSKLLAARAPHKEPIEIHDLGRMSDVCQHCSALHWKAEQLSASKKDNVLFGTCCNSGRVQLPPLDPPPTAIRDLFTSQGPAAKEFRANIRQYNNAFAFTSLGVPRRRMLANQGGGPYSFRIQGELCHWSGSLAPNEGEEPVFAQLYIYDPTAAHEARCRNNRGLNPLTLQTLQDVLWDSHPYAAIYRHAHELLLQDESPEFSIRLHCIGDKRRYNLPIANEVAVVIPGNEDAEAAGPRDIILHRRTDDTTLQSLYDGHPAYACLHYVLLFPTGQHGWHWALRLNNTGSAEEEDDGMGSEGDGDGNEDGESEGKRRLTQTRFYAYRLHQRVGEFSTILHAGKLLQQYIVDAWASSDQTRLNWFRANQSTIRASLYSGLQDATANADNSLDLNSIGRRMVLPSSYIGGARHMHGIFQDSMAIARYFKKIDLFITMTANPQWLEVQQELLPGQEPSDRPDLIARVFRLKRDALLDDIIKNGIFGRVVARIYTIEFQKRGLPHMHLLIFLEDSQKLDTANDVDSCIRAYWPDPETEPQLFKIVKQVMVHGPCGSANPRAPCNDEKGQCTKGYPRPFQDGTTMDEEGYPVYHRPNDGREYVVRGAKVHNGHIVPHNPYLSTKYQCHVNVECAVRYGPFRPLPCFINSLNHNSGLRQSSTSTNISLKDMTARRLRWRATMKSANISTAVSWEHLKEHGGSSISTCTANPLTSSAWTFISLANTWFTSILMMTLPT